MNRLTDRMNELMEQKGKAFIAYIMAGEPSWDSMQNIILEMEKEGVTAVELGVPFSDPIADGPVIQAAGNRALERGVTLDSILKNVKALRQKTKIPILLMGYWNVFLQFGKEKVLRSAVECGVDGFIIADLPPESEVEFFEQARSLEICTVLLASALTSETRLKEIVCVSTGFIYYVPQTGITGLDLNINSGVKDRIKLIKSMCSTPVCIGIGVKTREDIERLNKVADGVIMGTRIVDFIDTLKDAEDIARQVGAFVKTLI